MAHGMCEEKLRLTGSVLEHVCAYTHTHTRAHLYIIYRHTRIHEAQAACHAC